MLESSWPIIQLLADGEFHSGETIAKIIGVSRTSIWKKIKKLIDSGVEIDIVKGKGYRMQAPFELLNEAEIQSLLNPLAQLMFPAIDIFETIDSTNQEVLRKIEWDGGVNMVCLAEYQTLGRGRRGRSWHSPLGNVALSLAWGFEGGMGALEGLSLVVGIAVVDALEHFGVQGVHLKWPNDVLYQDRKLAGILLEVKAEANGLCQLVIGIGLNMALARNMEKIDQPFVSITDMGYNVSRNALCAQLLSELSKSIHEFSRHGFEPFRSRWLELDRYYQKPVMLSSGVTKRFGVSQGVDANGALLLQEGDQLSSVHAGELSLRSADDS